MKHKQVTTSDDCALTALLAHFSGVEDGVDVLQALRAPTAHSQAITVVTYDTLVVAVQAQFTDADPTKVDVMAVLDCLQHLAVSMNETMFVVTA
jgi:hypothetical protein